MKTGKPAHVMEPTHEQTEGEQAANHHYQHQQQQQFSAGSELLLECVTPDLGQPRANIWLWFKNGQPIESSNSISNLTDEPQAANRDNPINGQDLSIASQPSISDSSGHHRRRNGASLVPQHQPQSQVKQTITSSSRSEAQSKIKLISSGRYLFISSIQLIHKGNYSCVAVNRLGAFGSQSSVPANLERDSYQVRVALAPSFVQPLAPRTYWPEVYVPSAVATTATSLDQLTNSRQLELVCHVQCEPICQIEWLRNNEPLEYNRQSGSMSSNFVSYQVKQSIMDENIEAGLFKSVESKLVLQFREGPVNGHSGGEPNSAQQQLDRERTLERRHLLNGANYTCQSGPNSMGPSVRSTTKFIVQYPPENLLINAPSDKLSLVEGGNGPRLSCESAGEPQVQYRWLLVKSNAGNDLALPSKRSAKRSVPISQSSSGAAGELAADYAINQATSKAFELASPSSKGANDPDAAGLAETELIELAGANTEPGNAPQTTISTLDLSNLSLDRRQSGHYICEASNRLGQARQSVFVNVQYKPTCAALHLYSLDMTTKSLLVNGIKSDLKQHQGFETNLIQSGSYIKPAKATNHDEYAIVKETSDDFITLRKKLILSPLLNRQSSKDDQSNELSFKDSIFQSILNDKGGASDGSDIMKSSSSEQSGRATQFRYKDALVNLDTKSDINNQADNLLVTDSKLLKQNDNGHPWNKFNSLLLNFLNSYMKSIKSFEEQFLINNGAIANTINNINQQLSRRSSNQPTSDAGPSEGDKIAASVGFDDQIAKENARNLITFACMAQDGNPMSNLTFDWSFGSTNLPETDEPPTSLSGIYSAELNDKREPSIKPQLVYVNDNYTLQVLLVRRHDTKSSLSPFQMSLLTLNIVIEPLASFGGPNGLLSSSSAEAIRQTEWTSQLNRTSPTNNHSNLIPRAPVIRSRQASHYNALRASVSQNNINSNNNNNNQNNNIQFARELEMRPYNLGSALPSGLDLNEENWQEQISNLLKCTVTNRIGTSEVCHARVNLAERMKSQQSSTSASTEFAKWRMPSLAHKSVLIISITVACILVVFGGFALLISSYLRNINPKSSGDLRCCKDETNTGQSTSSQKSSVLGLLGNGDSSLQSSSDDDSSARLNHHHHHQHNHPNHHHATDNQNRCQSRIRLDFGDSSMTSQTLMNSDNYPNQLSCESSANYDQPRGLHEPPAMYHTSAGLNYNETTPDKLDSDTLDGCHYRDGSASVKSPISQDSQILNASDLSNQGISTRGRLLAPAYSNIINSNKSLSPLDEYFRQRDIDPLTGEQNNPAAFYRSQQNRNHHINSSNPQSMYLMRNDLNQFQPQQVNRGPPIYPRSNQASTLYKLRLAEEALRPSATTRSSNRQIMEIEKPQQYQTSSRINRLSMPTYNQSFTARPTDVQPTTTLSYMNTIDSHLNRMADAVALSQYPGTHHDNPAAYVNAGTSGIEPTNQQEFYNSNVGIQNQSTEHIYDTNAYATPEQTPMRANLLESRLQIGANERPRVHHLIQTFNSRAPLE